MKNCSYMNIPVQLIRITLEQKIKNTVKLYLYLKWITSGHFILNGHVIKSICNNLGYKTPKTFYKHLNLLLKWKWITINSSKERYRIISYKQLAKKLSFRAYMGVIFEPVDFSKLNAFMYGAIISYFVKYRRRADSLSRSKGSGRSSNRNGSSSYNSLPCKYLAGVLNISQSTASEYKQLAHKHGFITVVKKYETLDNVPSDNNNYWKELIDKPNAIVLVDGKFQIQLADEITPNVYFRSKKEIKKHLKLYGKNPKR